MGRGDFNKPMGFWVCGYFYTQNLSTYTIFTVPGSDLAFVDLLTSTKSGNSKIALLAIVEFTGTFFRCALFAEASTLS